MTTEAKGHARTIRKRLAAAVVLVAALALLLDGCSWAQFRWGPEHTGTNPFETTIGVGNVLKLQMSWEASAGGQISSSPAIASGVLYVGGFDDGKLYALNATNGTTLWTAQTNGEIYVESPAVARGIVYIDSAHVFPNETTDGLLYAFDAAGQVNCFGNPKTCAPLWTADLGATSGLSSPTVKDGIVYVGSDDDKLYVFDAAGNANCSGTPKTCRPLWTATTGGPIGYSSPAVANGAVYVGSSDHTLYAFDAAGSTNCSGTPKTCAALWTALTGGSLAASSPAVANGIVYIGSGDRNLYAFDASGNTNCSGTPKTCVPSWIAPTDSSLFSSPAVANGVVYIGSHTSSTTGTFYALDAAGNINCSGTPKTCSPLWTAAIGGDLYSSPVVANSVVYIGYNGAADAPGVSAFDAAGSVNCSGNPKTCTSLWPPTLGTNSTQSSPAVVNGHIYIGTDSGQVIAYGLPPT